MNWMKLILQTSDSFHSCSVLYDSSETALRHPDGPIRQQFACPPCSIGLVRVSIKHNHLDLDLGMTLQSYQLRWLYSHCPWPLQHWKTSQKRNLNFSGKSLLIFFNLLIKFPVWNSKLLAGRRRLLILCSCDFSPNWVFGVCVCLCVIEFLNITKPKFLVEIDAVLYVCNLWLLVARQDKVWNGRK